VHFSRDGARLVVATGVTGLRGVAMIFDAGNGRRVAEFGEGHSDVLFDAEISPDGKLLATAGYDQTVKVWKLADGSLVRSLKAHNGAVFDLAFNRDGSILASASADETVKLWNVANGQRLDTLNQPQGEQFSVAFTPDDRHVLAAGADNRIRMWRLISRKQPRINPVVHSRFAHEDDIVKLAVDPKGRWVVSSSADRSLKLWSLPGLVQREMFSDQPDLAAAVVPGRRGSDFTVARMDGSFTRYVVRDEEAAAGVVADEAAREVPLDATVAKPIALTESEPNESADRAELVKLPATISGSIGHPGDADVFAFDAKAGEEWILEIAAARNKSPLDSIVAVLDSTGQPIKRLELQALRDSWLTFRGKDSSTANDFRVHNWREMELNEYLYVNGEVVKLFLYPRGPDSGFKVYPGYGSRHTYFGTTAKAHPLGQNCYIVRPVAASETLIPNGLPTFPVYFENDDEPLRRWGKDSQLRFRVPKDGRYLARVADVRGAGGPEFKYALTIRRRRPDFAVSVKGGNPTVSPGSGKEFFVEVERRDGFDGEIRIDALDLPPGFTASTPMTVEAGHFRAWGVVNAAADAKAPTGAVASRSRLVAAATIGGREVRREIGGLGTIKLGKAPKVTVAMHPDGKSGSAVARPGKPLEFTIAPGETISALVRVQRSDFKGRIALGKEDAGRNLPHGVYVDNIGLNGLLIVEGESERQFFITAAKWVPESTRYFHLVAGVDGNQASLPAILQVRRRPTLAAR